MNTHFAGRVSAQDYMWLHDSTEIRRAFCCLGSEPLPASLCCLRRYACLMVPQWDTLGSVLGSHTNLRVLMQPPVLLWCWCESACLFIMPAPKSFQDPSRILPESQHNICGILPEAFQKPARAHLEHRRIPPDSHLNPPGIPPESPQNTS